jgi:hypothetical protein
LAPTLLEHQPPTTPSRVSAPSEEESGQGGAGKLGRAGKLGGAGEQGWTRAGETKETNCIFHTPFLE